MDRATDLADAAERLANQARKMTFSPPVRYVYNPLDYARESHSLYLKRYGNNRKRIIFLGMNPGPWGMAQTGIPFGDVEKVKNWLGIETAVANPPVEHPKRPVQGFYCKRSEVSGTRLWGLFQDIYTTPEDFFREHFVANYCPLVFMEESGRNRTPDKLRVNEKATLFESCDQHLRQVARIMEPEWVIGVGRFAEASAQRALRGLNVRIAGILHPSPANPAANRGWGRQVTLTMQTLNLWRG